MSSPTADTRLIKPLKLQGTYPERKRRFGAAPWFGNPRFIDSKYPAKSVRALRDGRHATMPGMLLRKTRHTRKESNVRAKRRRLEIQQEVTEETEDRLHLRSLRCLLFKPPALRSHAERPNSSATAATRRTDCNCDGPPPWRCSASLALLSFVFIRPTVEIM